MVGDPPRAADAGQDDRHGQAHVDGDARKAARNALSAPLQKNIEKIKIDGEKATVEVRMPLVLPGIISSKNLLAARTAELPR